ncbi:hypothetical protein HK104_007438, partial [Borealophlyctis nickersoniae]
MRKPSESYLVTVTLFEDLPRVTTGKGVSEAFLRECGVREHVELQVVFDRVGVMKWDHGQLVKYLASVQTKLLPTELNRLKVTPLFPRESDTADGKRYKASELYIPSDVLRSFGLPIVQWSGKWRNGSDEARLFTTLGIRHHVPLEIVIQMAATAEDKARRARVLAYFVDNYKGVYAPVYNPAAVITPFLPTTQPDVLATPAGCFADPTASVVGCKVLHAELRQSAEVFGVRMHPPPDVLVRYLQKGVEPGRAVEVFAYMAGRQGDFTRDHWSTIRTLKFIPVPLKDAPRTPASPQPYIHVPPTLVYFSTSSSSTTTTTDHFTRIDFGSPANTFLRTAGVKDEPTPLELAARLVETPTTFLESVGVEGYLGLLRRVAAQWGSVAGDRALVERMKSVEW